MVTYLAEDLLDALSAYLVAASHSLPKSRGALVLNSVVFG